MKYIIINTILLHLLFILGVNCLNAQEVQKNAFYHSGEFNAGNYYGLNLNANYVRDEKYSFQLGYSAHFRKAKEQPDNYTSGFVGIILMGLPDPIDQVENFQALSGRIFHFNPKGTIRVNILAGVGLTIIREPENYEATGYTFLAPNYTYVYNSRSTFSLILNPKIEFPFTRYYGFTLSPLIHINKDRNFYGVGIGHMAGLLRRKNPSKENNE